MKQLVNLPSNPDNQEHARICCNAELQLKHWRRGGIGLIMQQVLCFSCVRLCPAGSVQSAFHTSPQDGTFLQEILRGCSLENPLAQPAWKKSSWVKASDCKPSWKGWCLVVTSRGGRLEPCLPIWSRGIRVSLQVLQAEVLWAHLWMPDRTESLGTGNTGGALRGNRCHVQDVTRLPEITARRVLRTHCNSVENYLNLSLHLVVGRAQEMAPIP